MGGLAAARDAGPRQILRRVAPGDIAFLPRNAEHFSSHAVDVADRLGSEIADAGLDVESAVRLDDEKPVEPDGARRRNVLIETPTPRTFVPFALAGARLSLVPLELLRAAVERFLDERAGGVGLLASHRTVRTSLCPPGR